MLNFLEDEIKDTEINQTDDAAQLEETEDQVDDFETNLADFKDGKEEPVEIVNEIKDSFLDYAMSVIVDRALPDVRDGLKPVQRRILFAMNELNILPGSAHKKSARIVGEVIGKYHPHGDSSVYEAMVRMAQDFSYLHPLVDGHGNFGSVDGDGAAAMRYTEARMSKVALDLVKDLEKETVDFIANYDGSEQEPKVLPARFPNLLVNGVKGIAVGMATSIPPHNMQEVLAGTIALIENPDMPLADLMNIIKGPDFPTGGEILDLNGLYRGYLTGQGRVVIRSIVEIQETKSGKAQIIIKEIPYLVNRKLLIEKISELVKDKIVDGIVAIADESNRKGTRLVLDLRRDVIPEVVLNNLYKYSQLQSSFAINMIALVNGVPKQLGLIPILKNFIEFQIELLIRKTKFELKKAEARIHIIKGLIKALSAIDLVVKLIKESKTPEVAKTKLIENLDIDEVQAKAILALTLQRLTSLEIDKIHEEHQELLSKIEYYNLILSSPDKQKEIIKGDLQELMAKYTKPRRSILNLSTSLDIENEDLIPRKDVIITVTENGYVKRIDADQYRVQSRGGVGASGIKINEDDKVQVILKTSSHDQILIFTNFGRVYQLKAFKIPEASKQGKGLPLVNLIDFQEKEHFQCITNLSPDLENGYLFFLTKGGKIKKTHDSEFSRVNANGKKAIQLLEGDELLQAVHFEGNPFIMIATKLGQALKFKSDTLRPLGRTSQGVRSITLAEGDEIIGCSVVKDEETDVLVISEFGLGKRTQAKEYRTTSRVGKGVKTIKITEKTGKLVALIVASDQQDLIASTDLGVVIRTPISEISRTSRNTQGVKIIKPAEGSKVQTITLDESFQPEEISEPTAIAESETK